MALNVVHALLFLFNQFNQFNKSFPLYIMSMETIKPLVVMAKVYLVVILQILHLTLLAPFKLTVGSNGIFVQQLQ